jgi:hypothetical protein
VKNIIWKVGLALIGVSALAQSVDEFDAWMRTIDEKNQSVQRNIAAKDAASATADAKTLDETFQLVEKFWKERGNAPDAVELSQKARQQAAAVAKAIAAKDFDAASTESIHIAETCTACHRLYRPLWRSPRGAKWNADSQI